MPIFPALGDALVGPPEIVVIEFLTAGRLERVDIATLRVHAGHHVLDGAVFPCGVHGLKNQQQRPAILRVEFLLHVAEQAHTIFQDVFGVLLAFDAVRIGGVEVLQPEFLAFGDAVTLDDSRGFLQLILSAS